MIFLIRISKIFLLLHRLSGCRSLAESRSRYMYMYIFFFSFSFATTSYTYASYAVNISLRFFSSGPALFFYLFNRSHIYLDTAFQYANNFTMNEFPEAVWKQSFNFLFFLLLLFFYARDVKVSYIFSSFLSSFYSFLFPSISSLRTLLLSFYFPFSFLR